MQKSRIIFVSILISFVLIGIFLVFAAQTKFYVYPSSIVDGNLGPNKMFTVNVSVSDAVDLYGYEFRLSYDTKILNVTNATASDFLSSSLYCAKRVINNEEGYVWIACMMPLATETGVSGSGTLETITFLVTGWGESNLDLYKTVLGDHNGKAISHEAIDGYFKNEVPLPDLIIEDIWTSENRIYYRIKNQGNANAGYSYSKLFIDDYYKAYDYVPSLAAGSSSNEYFSYSWSCSGSSDSIKVCADGWNYVKESDENNNCLTKTFNCPTTTTTTVTTTTATGGQCVQDIDCCATLGGTCSTKARCLSGKCYCGVGSPCPV